MTLIDWRDGRPIYEQIVENIKRLILMDVLRPGEQLPSVRSLAMENGTNPNTVQKAYAELERQGFSYTVRGRGVFVADAAACRDRRRTELVEHLTGILAEAAEVGLDPGELCREALSRQGQLPDGNGGADRTSETVLNDCIPVQGSSREGEAE
ncbi:MAG: GntR family transcriptional regulator [Lachnospiraceae bacterium]|nr:GntR family transcriptional regulator [Lachnospiraceae bacterium]